jgi:hypothetical protein
LTSASRDAFQSIPLVAPLARTLADKKAAMERALAGYQAATVYAVAEVTPPRLEMGESPLTGGRSHGRAPANLDTEELEEYDLLDGTPFEKMAVESMS